jgi:hypothetical protein
MIAIAKETPERNRGEAALRNEEDDRFTIGLLMSSHLLEPDN